MIETIDHVNLVVRDLEAMTAFYRDTLELPVHSVRPTFVTFEWGPMRLNIGVHSDVKGQTAEPLRVMVNLSVEDIHRTYEVLVAHLRRSTGAAGGPPSPTPTAMSFSYSSSLDDTY